jgi:hypothetical protein
MIVVEWLTKRPWPFSWLGAPGQSAGPRREYCSAVMACVRSTMAVNMTVWWQSFA